MKGTKGVFLFLFLSVPLLCCKKNLTEKEYLAWVRDFGNGLHAQREINEFVVDVQFQPTQLMALQRSKSHVVDEEEMEGLKEMQYYLLTLSVKGDEYDFIRYGVSDVEELQRKEYYFSYNFQENIRLEDPDGKILPCILYHFEKPINLAKSRTFVLGFMASEAAETTLVMESEYIHSLPIKIKINKTDYPHSIAL